jgi:hypothetical protein
MPPEILVHHPSRPSGRVALAGPVTGGGSQTDAVHLPGLPPAAIRLEPCAAGVIVVAAAAGVRVAGHAVPPAARRPLPPRERATVLGAALELPAPPVDGGTRVAAAALLRDAAAGDPLPPGAYALILTGPAAGLRIRLGAEQIIGRSRAAEIRLPDPLASRRHARLRVGADGASIEDLGAKNGVRVSGIRVERRRPRPLTPGEEIAIGDTILTLVVPWEAGTAPPAASGPQGPRGGRRRRHRGSLAAAALFALSAAALLLASS